MKNQSNTHFDNYLTNGCMRCKYGETPKCKVLNWTRELKLLRQIVLETELIEEIKWGLPVYTLDGKNIVSVNALKASANITFFKGSLLTDKHKILQRQGNIQAGRIAKYTSVKEIENVKDILRSYVLEAINIEKAGKKVEIKKNQEPVPEELLKLFEEDSAFKKAFYALTPGRQRGYIIYFSQPKQIKTRIQRIEKHKENIFKGIGLNDIYSSGK
jgi:uncharacterized protein YdeI (YjbR/CyaY-like superfamily)